MARKRKKKSGSRPLSVGLISLGCAKNLVDSERLLGRLGASGFPLCYDPEEADVVLVNTCAFIQAAVEESSEVLGREVARRERGECTAVAALGCLPSRFGRGGRVPGIDGWFGIGDLDGIAAWMASLSRKRKRGGGPAGPANLLEPTLDPLCAEGERLRLTPKHWAYLRITEGCGNRCRYCTIPTLRGPLRCKPLAEIVREARELVASGAREIVLIGQDTGAWVGSGTGGLERVIEALSGIPELAWLRILYTHPAHVSPELVRLLASGLPLVPYLDMPIQHASAPVLRAMGRPTTPQMLSDLVKRMRDAVEGLVLRTTVMVGFPGETEADVQALLRFLEEARFERLGAFLYSPEEGTEAFTLPGRVDGETGRRRLEAVLALADKLRDTYHRERIGGEEEAVADWSEGERVVARTTGEAPEVDPVLRIPGRAAPGLRGRVRIEALEGPDLTARWL
ncbi:MAG: 30S ribosomal protein S12 methylthiotransferase RimO [Planctomycetota bacterium]|jgi:ribosomal protein S12 methylthiotransferase